MEKKIIELEKILNFKEVSKLILPYWNFYIWLDINDNKKMRIFKSAPENQIMVTKNDKLIFNYSRSENSDYYCIKDEYRNNIIFSKDLVKPLLKKQSRLIDSCIIV